MQSEHGAYTVTFSISQEWTPGTALLPGAINALGSHLPQATDFSRSRWQSPALLLPAFSLQSLPGYKSNCAPLNHSTTVISKAITPADDFQAHELLKSLNGFQRELTHLRGQVCGALNSTAGSESLCKVQTVRNEEHMAWDASLHPSCLLLVCQHPLPVTDKSRNVLCFIQTGTVVLMSPGIIPP